MPFLSSLIPAHLSRILDAAGLVIALLRGFPLIDLNSDLDFQDHFFQLLHLDSDYVNDVLTGDNLKLTSASDGSKSWSESSLRFETMMMLRGELERITNQCDGTHIHEKCLYMNSRLHNNLNHLKLNGTTPDTGSIMSTSSQIVRLVHEPTITHAFQNPKLLEKDILNILYFFNIDIHNSDPNKNQNNFLKFLNMMGSKQTSDPSLVSNDAYVLKAITLPQVYGNEYIQREVDLALGSSQSESSSVGSGDNLNSKYFLAQPNTQQSLASTTHTYINSKCVLECTFSAIAVYWICAGGCIAKLAPNQCITEVCPAAVTAFDVPCLKKCHESEGEGSNGNDEEQVGVGEENDDMDMDMDIDDVSEDISGRMRAKVEMV